MVATRAHAQVPEIPTVYSDPSANCYALLSRPVIGGVEFSLVRLDPKPACDLTSPPGAIHFVIARLISEGVQSSQLMPMRLGEVVVRTMPDGVYQVFPAINPVDSRQRIPVTSLQIGNFSQNSIVFVGDPQLWDSEKFAHVPFATTVYPPQIDGRTLTFGTSLHGRTTGVFYQLDADGSPHYFRADVASGNPTIASVTLPDGFVFDAPIFVNIIDDTTSFAGDYKIFDPVALKLTPGLRTMGSFRTPRYLFRSE
jgi:hypothetical protein